jgi:outer membrane biosynthesis protein TonB
MLGFLWVRGETLTEKHNACHPNKPQASLSGTSDCHPNKPQAGLSGTPGWRLLAGLSLALVLALAFASGCSRNKNRQTSPQATVPAIAVPPTAQAGQHPAPPVQTTPPPATSAETGAIRQPSASQAKAKPKPQKNSARKTAPAAAKQAPTAQVAPPAQPSPQKPPAAASSEGQVQIAAQVPQGTAQNTEQLLQAAEGNLRKVTRQLSDGEQAMLRQARNYITQSRSATQDGDLERAYNLAMKANLLSGELAK